MKKVMLKTTLGLAVTLASSQIFASGFALNEQSVSGMGTGFAGRSSSADDASTVFGNPAGMSRLSGQQVTGGIAVIDASTDIKDANGSIKGTNKGDMVPFTGVPMGFYTNKLNDQWAVGFGVYAPFGLVTDYESSFQGRGFGSKSEVKVITLQPTVSYAFNDRVSVGFGPTINRIAGTLVNLSDWYLKMGDYRNAVVYAQQALDALCDQIEGLRCGHRTVHCRGAVRLPVKSAPLVLAAVVRTAAVQREAGRGPSP